MHSRTLTRTAHFATTIAAPAITTGARVRVAVSVAYKRLSAHHDDKCGPIIRLLVNGVTVFKNSDVVFAGEGKRARSQKEKKEEVM